MKLRHLSLHMTMYILFAFEWTMDEYAEQHVHLFGMFKKLCTCLGV
jgi:hypothetical protein